MRRYLPVLLISAGLAGLLPPLGTHPGLNSAGQLAAAEKDAAWGTVKGHIVYGGATVPEPKQLDVNKEQQHCLSKGPILSEEWVIDPKTKGVRWTFVWLVDASNPKYKLPIHPDLKEIKVKEVELDQPTCRFEPHAVAVRQGQDLLVKNSAPIAHNVHWVGFKNAGNTLVPSKQEYRITGLVPDRLPSKINCDIHGWMTANLWVFDHPYYAVTDATGKFEIKQAPAGKYRLVIWHDTGWGPGGRPGTEVTIKGGEVTDVGDLELKPGS